jgi:hypothetical protein
MIKKKNDNDIAIIHYLYDDDGDLTARARARINGSVCVDPIARTLQREVFTSSRNRSGLAGYDVRTIVPLFSTSGKLSRQYVVRRRRGG